MEENEQADRLLPYGRTVQTEARLRRRRAISLLLAAIVGAVVALALAFAVLLYGGVADGSQVQEAARRVLPLAFSTAEPQEELPGGGLPIPWPDDDSLDPADDLPADKLFVTAERRGYRDKDFRLVIPVLELDEAVYDGTDTATLNKGACLYEVSQLPGRGNRNVSIAGHRNGVKNGRITEIMFYHLDKVGEGDYLYLCDDEKVFRYLYEYTVTVEEDDWSEIYSKGYSSLTLTTCTPIGVADRRLIVSAALDGVFYKTENFDFIANNTM
ncbi:MAG: sortase [Clostridiales Family XIII bacterium]|jgi:LPXTG-site transpeptidase (sortase) family protein|nr:sortase [Clostridiales Family XIII bacterium]